MNRLLFAASSLLLSCTQAIELPVRTDPRLLIVEGFITNEPGPYTVRLTRSANYESAFRLDGVISNETGAALFIRDAEGGSTELVEVADGYYQTPADFVGQVGTTYSLNIFTAADESFVSRPVTLPAGADIENIELRYKEQPSSDPVSFGSGVNVFVTFQDRPGENNFYMTYRDRGVYPFTSQPEIAELNPFNPCIPIQDLPRCFRYERDYFNPSTAVTTSQSCLVIRPESFDFLLIDDRFRDGTEITDLASFVEDDGRRFEFSYRTRINLLSIPSEAFGFYERLATQLEIDGDIFDPPPAEILGNIVNIGSTENPAIGYFGAYHLSSREVYLESDLLAFKQTKVVFGNDCINFDSSSVEKPVGWTGSSW